MWKKVFLKKEHRLLKTLLHPSFQQIVCTLHSSLCLSIPGNPLYQWPTQHIKLHFNFNKQILKKTYTKYTSVRLKILEFCMLTSPLSKELKMHLAFLEYLATEHGYNDYFLSVTHFMQKTREPFYHWHLFSSRA